MFESLEIKLSNNITVAITKEINGETSSSSIEVLQNGIKLLASKKLVDNEILRLFELFDGLMD